MSTPNSHLSQRVAVAGALDPQNVDNTTAESDFVDLSKFGRVAFIISAGAIDADTTVAAQLREATDDQGTSAQLIAGKVITTLPHDGDNQQAIIELAAEELSANFGFASCLITVTGSTADVAITAIAGDARFEPASAGNATSVAEIVA